MLRQNGRHQNSPGVAPSMPKTDHTDIYQQSVSVNSDSPKTGLPDLLEGARLSTLQHSNRTHSRQGSRGQTRRRHRHQDRPQANSIPAGLGFPQGGRCMNAPHFHKRPWSPTASKSKNTSRRRTAPVRSNTAALVSASRLSASTEYREPSGAGDLDPLCPD